MSGFFCELLCRKLDTMSAPPHSRFLSREGIRRDVEII